ncbi:MAG: hypothetical protein RBR86_06655 [Pseudobdellovibrionaceae bacterium]|jgi:hypothetical protein|nr:hypothetical protein [Pseudobdellovibrionaceae bacterium]
MSFSYQRDIGRKSYPESGLAKNIVARSLMVLAVTSLMSPLVPKAVEASPYSTPPYENTACPCCVLPGQIMYEMFWGVLNWAGQDDLHNKFYIEKMFEDRIEPALKDMADELHTAAIAPAFMIGAFLDGQAENNALNTVQKLNSETIKDYHVSDQICRVGTVSRSLAQSDDKARVVQLGMMEEIVGRQLLRDNYNSGDASGEGVTIGRSVDKVGRWNQFKNKFCDPSDINRGLASTASGVEKCEATSDKQANMDIDFAKTLEIPSSLNVNFDETTPTKTSDEENLIALASNIYAHNLSVNLGASDLHALKTDAKDEQIKKLFEFRSLVAKRSVAENSFAAQAGLKAAGSAASKTYIDNIIKELGLSSTTDIKALIGDNPSYDTQMEVLTKRLYQSPKFYVNLYDTPANVERQKTALKAISLMQDRDMYESLQRSEMLLSVMLELQVIKAQDRYFGKGQQN